MKFVKSYRASYLQNTASNFQQQIERIACLINNVTIKAQLIV